MGGLAGQAREARLTPPLWHDGPLDALAPDGGRAVAWSVRLDSQAAAAALALVPHTDRDLADFAAAPDAAHRLLRRRLVRVLLGRLSDVPPAAILFGRNAQGAPTVLSPKGWHVSVAGQAPLCLIGVARETVGVDVEPEDGAPPLWDMLTPAEAADLQMLPEAEQAHAWLRRWTAKEAHAKRVGEARRADPVLIETAKTGEDLLLATSAEGRSCVYLRAKSGRAEALALDASG